MTKFSCSECLSLEVAPAVGLISIARIAISSSGVPARVLLVVVAGFASVW
jgi:hypothetical protein